MRKFIATRQGRRGWIIEADALKLESGFWIFVNAKVNGSYYNVAYLSPAHFVGVFEVTGQDGGGEPAE